MTEVYLSVQNFNRRPVDALVLASIVEAFSTVFSEQPAVSRTNAQYHLSATLTSSAANCILSDMRTTKRRTPSRFAQHRSGLGTISWCACFAAISKAKQHNSCMAASLYRFSPVCNAALRNASKLYAAHACAAKLYKAATVSGANTTAASILTTCTEKARQRLRRRARGPFE